MIGRPEWFQRRKYGGWGITPKTWQGWIYIAIIFIPFAVFQMIPFWDAQLRIYVTIGWLAFLIIDASHIMINLRKDEMETKIEAISERNASWIMVLVLAIGILYQLISGSLQQKVSIDPFLIIALFSGMIMKSVSDIYLEKKGNINEDPH